MLFDGPVEHVCKIAKIFKAAQKPFFILEDGQIDTDEMLVRCCGVTGCVYNNFVLFANSRLNRHESFYIWHNLFYMELKS